MSSLVVQNLNIQVNFVLAKMWLDDLVNRLHDLGNRTPICFIGVFNAQLSKHSISCVAESLCDL